MSKKGKRFGKDISVNVAEESTPIKVAVKGTRKVKVPAEDLATELDEPIVPQKTGNAKVAPAEAKWVLKDPAVVGLASGSDNKPVQLVPAMSKPKPRPFKEPKSPMATSAPKEPENPPKYHHLSPPPPCNIEPLEASAQNTTLSESSDETYIEEASQTSSNAQREIDQTIQRVQNSIDLDQPAFDGLTY